MITANKFDAKNMVVIVKQLQHLGAGCCRKSWFHIHLSYASNLHITINPASAHKRLVLFWLIESPNQWPNLKQHNLQYLILTEAHKRGSQIIIFLVFIYLFMLKKLTTLSPFIDLGRKDTYSIYDSIFLTSTLRNQITRNRRSVPIFSSSRTKGHKVFK